MIRTLKSLKALLFAAFLLFIGNAFLLSSNSILLKELGFSDFQIGFVGSSIYFGALISTIISSKIIERVGHIRSFGFFISLFCLAALGHIFTQNIFAWMGLRFCIGFSYFALLVIIESWINNRSRNEIRSRILAVYETVFYSGFACGVLLLYLKPSYIYVFLGAAIVILLASLPLNLLKIKQPKLPKHKKISIPNIFSVSKLAFFAALVGGFLMNGYYSMSQTYFLALGYNAKDISLFIFTTMLGGFISQAFIGKISDFYGRKIAILGCVSLALAASCGLFFFAHIKTMAFILCFFLGMGLFCIYVLALARASDRAKESSQILEIGRTLLFTYSLSSVFSPIVLGYVVGHFGALAFISIYIILLGILLCFTLTQPKIEKELRIEFSEHPSQFVHLGKDE